MSKPANTARYPSPPVGSSPNPKRSTPASGHASTDSRRHNVSTRHDLVAERQLLAMALSGHPSVRDRFLALPMLVWHPSHEPVATVLRDRFRRNIPLNTA